MLTRSILFGAVVATAVLSRCTTTAAPAALKPVVEVEEDVYKFQPANNGAGPLWCSGSTCLVRIGGEVFASGLETIADAKPLNNCRWLLFCRTSNGWKLIHRDDSGRTREPSPLAGFPEGDLFLSANPTLKPAAYCGPARPEIVHFTSPNPARPLGTIAPVWAGEPKFTEHSYRSFAADGPSREMILFQNIDYTHAEWAFRDRAGEWSAQGKLEWPTRRDGDRQQPIRVCYPNVALHKRQVHFCGVSDILEPNPAWRAFKKQLTGREWDYDFRRLFYTRTDDIRSGKFQPWIEIASREATAGNISPGDLWVAPDDVVHIVWTERALDERLREKFFPDARQEYQLNYATLKAGQVTSRRTLHQAGPGGLVPSAARFQVTPEQRLFVVYFIQGTADSVAVSENRVCEILAGGTVGLAVRIPLKQPFTGYFTATTRAGSPPSRTLEMLGHSTSGAHTVSYARVRLTDR